MNRLTKSFAVALVVTVSSCYLAGERARAQGADSSLLLRAMEEELQRSMKELSANADPPPYFMSYSVTEIEQTRLASSYGALRAGTSRRTRLLDVEVRVGDYQLDNTRELRDAMPFARLPDFSGPVAMPLEDDIDAIKSILWLHTDRKYKAAADQLVKVRTNHAVTVDEEDASADFSRESPEVAIGPLASVAIDAEPWRERLKEYSALLDSHPEIHESDVALTAVVTNKYLVNSEGTRVQHGTVQVRVGLYAATSADDGMELYRYESFDAHSPDRLPGEDGVRDAINRMAADLLALREAPAIEPYTGPAILAGRAAAVFFHEIFGHRIEGHRQKSEREGQTFTKKIGERVLPEFVSVYSDPTRKQAGGTDLAGHYRIDDEGVRARPVTVVENGVLRSFLMSRSPVEGFVRSNGHGRRQPGRAPVGRQSNLIVESSQTVSESELRELLVEEIERQGKEFGLLFTDISGGFTFTGRGRPQVFQVTPIMVYRVYADGRPDELVRGADLIGTPLASFSGIIATGTELEVFNGFCGAESGMVPVSGIAPAILTAQIEIQKKPKGADRPPLLPRPRRGSR
ncbi:MAG: TldD/PmbA family protein [Acidobacteria bacterium]|nr:TldD/PmbA family protein [Acidobacteriota bacterium]MYH48691.1 TldD/PmbA family protein [Gammaproteobacteria bacterium]MYK80101.1 TldD/PmbA family protein [Acidobacteriota bacterium]